MKRVSFILFLFLAPFSIMGQNTKLECDVVYAKALALSKKGDYQLAIKKLTAYKLCSNNTLQQKRGDSLIIKIYETVNSQRIDAIKAKELAEKNEKEAKRQSRIAIEQRNKARANYLISEGNINRETDANRALLYYAYAYQINAEPATFKTIYDYYKKYRITVIDTASYLSNNRSDSINLFYIYTNKIKKKKSEYNYHTNIYSDRSTNLYLKNNSYYTIDVKGIIFFNILTNKEIKKISVDLSMFNNYITTSNSDIILFTSRTENNSHNSLVMRYNIKLDQLDYIFKDDKLMTENYSYENKRIEYFVSKNNEITVISQSDEDDDFERMSPHIVIVRENEIIKTFTSNLNNNDSINYSNIYAFNLGISNKSKYLLFNATKQEEKDAIRYYSDALFLYDLETNEKLRIINQEKDDPLKHDISNLLFTHDDNYIIWSNSKTLYQTRVLNYDGITLKSSVDFETITAIEQVKDRFIVTGHSNGELTFYENQKYDIWVEKGGDELDVYKHIKLPNNSSIETLYFDKKNNILYIINSDSDIYIMPINKFIKITNNHLKIVKELIFKLDIQDLTKEEKIKFQIE